MAQLEGVVLTPLKIIPDDRGQVMHFLRVDAPHFKKFGEIYFTTVYPHVTKGWRLHSINAANIAVPIGRVKFVLHDMRDISPTKGQVQEICLGDNCYQLLTIPPGIAYAWKNLVMETAFIANCSTEPHTPGEGKAIPLEEISYKW